MKPEIHPHAVCESDRIGDGSRVAAFALVRAGARIGREADIREYALVDGDVCIGDRVVVESGAQLRDGLRVEDDAFIGPNVTFANVNFGADARPRTTHVGRGASVGAGATILPGRDIGQNAVVGAGAVVTRSVPPNAIVAGNPARIRGYVAHGGEIGRGATPTPAADGGVQQSRVRGVSVHRLPLRRDLRGSLTVAESSREIPFPVKRYFTVFDVPSSEIRGEHAHRSCHLFLVCVHGSCALVADDGENREEFHLDGPTIGVHLPPMVWGSQYKHSPGAVLLVLASEYYEPDDYIRDYQQFLDEVRR